MTLKSLFQLKQFCESIAFIQLVCEVLGLTGCITVWAGEVQGKKSVQKYHLIYIDSLNFICLCCGFERLYKLSPFFSFNLRIHGFPVSAINTTHKCIHVEIDTSKLSLSATGIVKRLNRTSLVHSVSTARHRLQKIDSNGLPYEGLGDRLQIRIFLCILS